MASSSINVQYPRNYTVNGDTYSIILYKDDTVCVGDIDLTMINKTFDDIYTIEDDLPFAATVRFCEGLSGEEVGNYSLRFTPFDDVYELSGAYVKTFMYNNVPIYAWADPGNDEGDAVPYVDYEMFISIPQSGTYFLLRLSFNSYEDVSGYDTLPESVANYIDALTFFINGNRLELVEYPNVEERTEEI